MQNEKMITREITFYSKHARIVLGTYTMPKFNYVINVMQLYNY